MLRAQLQKWFGNGSRSARRPEQKPFRPGMELLEDRILLDTTSGIVVGRTLSAYSTADVQDNQVRITYTVYNQQADPVSGVLLTDTLQSGVTFQEASQLPDRNGQELAWNLGTIEGFSHASITLTVSLDTPTVLQLDSGARGFATLNAGTVTDDVPAAVLTDRVIPAELLAATPDADTTDAFVEEKAAELDYAPQRIFDFVSTGIGYEAYRGSLRGARGTLWSAAGNALDQTSLAVALLRGSGVPARYVRGTLADAPARELILSMFPNYTRVLGTLDADVPTADPTGDPQLLAEARDHFWVQLDTGDGFVDADPVIPGAQLGQTFTTPTGVFADVPDTLRHRVTVRLDREMTLPAVGLLTGGAAQNTATVLEATFTATEVAGKSLSVGHLVTSNVLPGGFATTSHNYSPYLLVNERAGTVGRERLIRGTDYQELFTSFPLGSKILTGATLTVTLQGPEVGGIRHTETIEKTLFDRFGIAARQNGAAVDLGTISATTGPAFSPLDVLTLDVSGAALASGPLSAQRQTVERLTAELANRLPSLDSPSAPLAIGEVAEVVQRLGAELTSFIAGRFQLDSNELADSLEVFTLSRTYLDSPRVIAVRQTYFIDPVTEEAGTDQEIDLLRNAHRVVTSPLQAEITPTVFQFIRGVVDSVLEQGVFGSEGTGSLDLLQQSLEQPGTVFVALSAENQSLLSSLEFSDEARARITTALVAGKQVLAPSKMVLVNGVERVAWLELDPESGNTIAVSDNGSHSGDYAGSLGGSSLNRTAFWRATTNTGNLQKIGRIGGNRSTRALDRQRLEQLKEAMAESGTAFTRIVYLYDPFLNQYFRLLKVNDIPISQWKGSVGGLGRTIEAIDPPVGSALFGMPATAPQFADLGSGSAGGVAAEAFQDPLFSVPFGGALLPTVFRIGVKNLTAVTDQFTIDVSDLPAGFVTSQSIPSVVLGPGEVGELSIAVHPTGTIPAAGSVFEFDVTATAATAPAVSTTITISFTMPALPAATFTLDPPIASTLPGAPVETTLTISSVGNVPVGVQFDLDLPPGVTLTGLAPVTLPPGGAATQRLTLTPAADLPLNSIRTVLLTPQFGQPDPTPLAIHFRIAAPGANAMLDAARVVTELGNTPLANRLGDLSLALSNLAENLGDDVFRGQALASLDSALTLLAGDELFVDYVEPLTAARDQLAAASTTTDVHTAILALGAALDDFAVVVTNLARHNFTVDLFPDSGIAQPLIPVNYAVRIQNTGSETTTYNVAVSGLPASVTSQFSENSLTVAPGQIAETILTLTQTSDTELLTFDFSVDVTAANVTPELRKAALGTMQARREHVSVTDVIATPPFGDPGTNVAVSAKILNAVNRQQDVLVSFTVKNATGQTVFTSNAVTATLTLQASLLTVDLGSLNTTGFAEGQYTIEIDVTDPSGSPIPGGMGQTTLLVGSPISASLTVDAQALPPGTSTVTNTLDITALVAPAEQLKLVGQLTERVFNGNTFPLNGFDVVVNGNIVYFADNFVLMSVDVSDPTDPVQVGPLLSFVQHLKLSGGRLVTTSARSGAFALRYYDVANPANPVERGAAAFGYLHHSDLEVIGNEAFVSTNLEILQSGDITEQFGDVLSLDLTTPFSSNSLDDVLFNTFGDTSSGDESFNIPRNGGPFNHFGMAAANATTLYVTSTTSTGTNVNLDQNGNPAKGIVRILDVSDPANLTQVGQIEIPGTIMVQQITIDGNRAYVLGSQGGWKDPYTNANDIGPVGNVVMAVLDISDVRNPTVIGTPTILNRYARGMAGLTAVGGNQFVFSSYGTLTDTPQLYLIDASDPAHLTVRKQIDTPGLIRGMSSDEEHLYVASDEGLFIYDLGHPDIPVTASVQIPKGTGVAVVPGSFNVPPTSTIEGADFDTLVWDFTLVQSAPAQTLTWDTTVSGLQPGESRPVTLGATIDFVAEGTAGRVTLPAEEVFAEQVLALSPSAQTVRPGQPAAYTLTVTNPTAVDVTYDLSVVGVAQEWVSMPAQVTVPARGSVPVGLTLTSDPFAPEAEHGFGVIARRDATSGSVTGTLRLQGDPVSQADPEAHGVVLTLTPAQATAGQGTSATFVVRLTNTGSITETFDLTAPSLPGITALFDLNSVSVPPGASNFREVRLTLTAAAGLLPNNYDFPVTATSRNSAATDTANGSLTVVSNGVDVTLDRTSASPGDTFQLTVKNTGTVTDTFDLSLGGPAALVSTLGATQVTLAPGASQVIPLSTTAVDFAVPGTLALAAVARSQGNSAVADQADAQLNIGETSGMTAHLDPGSRTLTAPGTVSYLLQVDNLGNTEDSYEAILTDTSGGLVASLADLDGLPTQRIPIFRLPGLASGAFLLNTRLDAVGQGTATVQVRSLTDGSLAATVVAALNVRPPVPDQPPPPPLPPPAVVGEGIATLPGTLGRPVRVEVRHVSASTLFRNEAGVILLDADGRIDGLKPGDPGFLLRALSRRFVLLRRGDRPGRRRKVVLPGGKPALFYLVQNSTLAKVLRSNPENRLGGGPLILLGFTEANPDRKPHVRLRGGKASTLVIGWEDLVGRSDQDFNDFVLSLRPL